jgi:hypothetical protein
MAIGNFNINDYLNKLYEEAEENSGGIKGEGKDGLIIPEENKKSFSWLKREYDKGKVEVKVEIKMGGAKFEPGYDMQTNLKSVKDFKPGMFGDVKTSDTPDNKKEVDKKVLDAENSKGQKKQPDYKVEKFAKGNKSVIKASVKTTEDTD